MITPGEAAAKRAMHGCVAWAPIEFVHRARWFGARGATAQTAKVCVCGCSVLRVWCPVRGDWTLDHGLSLGARRRAVGCGVALAAVVRSDAMPTTARGRPPQDGETRRARVELRAHEHQRDAWRAAAEAAGLELAEWMRDRLDAAAWETGGKA